MLALRDGRHAETLRTLTAVSRQFDEMLNRQPNRHAPYVGESAFAHKGGIHASAVNKDPQSYEHVPPESVGNTPEAVGLESGGALEHPGRACARRHGGRQGRPAPRQPAGGGKDAGSRRLCLRSRRRVLRAARPAGLRPSARFFDVESFRVMVERRHNAKGDLVTVSEAVVKVRIGDKL